MMMMMIDDDDADDDEGIQMKEDHNLVSFLEALITKGRP